MSIAYGTVNCWVAKVPAVVATLMVTMSPDTGKLLPELVKVKVRTSALPLESAPEVVTESVTLPALHAAAVLPLKVVHMDDPWKPAFDGVPWTSSDPSVSATDPTFLTITVAVHDGVHVLATNVAESMDMLDCAAMFCWLC